MPRERSREAGHRAAAGESSGRLLVPLLLKPVANRQATSREYDFDLSPEGRELVLEQVQEHSDVVLIGRRPRK